MFTEHNSTVSVY